MKFRLLAIFIGLVIVSGTLACQEASEGDAPPPATATASVLQSQTEAIDPENAAQAVVRGPCYSEEGFRYGAEVLALYEGGIIYKEANPQSDHVRQTKHMKKVEITGNSICIDDRIWWPVEFEGREGWIMERSLVLKPDPGPCMPDWRPSETDTVWRKFGDFAVTYQKLVVEELVEALYPSGENGTYTELRERLRMAREAIAGPLCGEYIRVPDGF